MCGVTFRDDQHHCVGIIYMRRASIHLPTLRRWWDLRCGGADCLVGRMLHYGMRGVGLGSVFVYLLFILYVARCD